MTAGFRLLVSAAVAVLLSAVFPAAASAQKVALLAAEIDGRVIDVKAKLVGAGLADVTIINVADRGVPLPPTPTLTDLQHYDAIFTWSNYSYANAGPLGDVLADYVDQGGGLVQAVFSFYPAAPVRLDGRWRSDAYEPFSFGLTERDFFLNLVATQTDHPILSGVTTFNGGGFSFHNDVQPKGCADVIARWSNGRPLVAARLGPRGGRVIGLNFYPPSNAADNPDFWVASTHGGVLMANALRFAATPAPTPPADAPAVALLAADAPTWVEDVRCKLQQAELFSRVDTIDVRSPSTPSLATLLQYDAVLTWSNSHYGDSTGLGNVLADYVDQNRGVVQSVFSFDSGEGPRLDGRWRTDGYRPLTEANSAPPTTLTLVPNVPGHVILSGVGSFSGGTSGYHSNPVALDAATTLVASWSNGQPLVAVGTKPSGGRVVGLNLFPPSSDARSDLWDRSTDGARLIANTLLFAANHFPTADAGADQTIDATSSAGASFTINATATDVDGDALTVSWSGAVSASGSTVTIDVPPPTAPNKTQTYTVTLTVSDGKGGEATDSVDLTVADTAGPVLLNIPSGTLTADATSGAGAEVAYGPVTATDAVDGDRPVVCSPPGVFPIGDTLVTCSSSDSRDNTTSATFTVRVIETDVATPGKMHGYGFIRENDTRYQFAFAVSESASGTERGGLYLRAKSAYFVTKTVESVMFSDSSTVLFSGAGRWNGTPGYRYEVFAVDKGKSGRRHPDVVRITITAPGGAIVAHVDGPLSGGRIESGRVPR